MRNVHHDNFRICMHIEVNDLLWHSHSQACNQLGTLGGAKSFLRGAQVFETMFTSFKICPTHFSRVVEKFSRGPSPPLRPPWLWAWS